MILIVDDKKENLFSLKTLLQLNGYDTDTASSGEEALRKILKNEYALIILDVQMPDMDGYEVAETVVGYSKTKDIPILFLSAVNIDKRFVARGYNSGGVDYITKPFDPDLLLLKVKTFCRLYEQNRTLKETQAALKAEIDVRRQAQAALQEANISLEEKVKDRTRALLQTNAQLESSNAELAQYASLASHDLQEPLRKIITFGGIIEERFLQNSAQAHEYMSKLINSSERMRNLINDLLNYSKLSVDSYFTFVDLHAVAQTTVNDLEVPITEKKARIYIGDLGVIEAIPGQIRQLFQNLLSNALKFSKENEVPVIRIDSYFTFERSLAPQPAPDGNYICLRIADNGIGFDEIYTDKIFTIFQRLHGKTEYEGTGIGLSIVKKIVEKHHGLLTASSQPDAGATFTIILPVTQQPAASKAGLTA